MKPIPPCHKSVSPARKQSLCSIRVRMSCFVIYGTTDNSLFPTRRGFSFTATPSGKMEPTYYIRVMKLNFLLEKQTAVLQRKPTADVKSTKREKRKMGYQNVNGVLCRISSRTLHYDKNTLTENYHPILSYFT